MGAITDVLMADDNHNKLVAELREQLATERTAREAAERERDEARSKFPYAEASGHYCDGMSYAWSDVQAAIAKELEAEQRAAAAEARNAEQAKEIERLRAALERNNKETGATWVALDCAANHAERCTNLEAQIAELRADVVDSECRPLCTGHIIVTKKLGPVLSTLRNAPKYSWEAAEFDLNLERSTLKKAGSKCVEVVMFDVDTAKKLLASKTALKAEYYRCEKLEAQHQQCQNGHTYLANSHEYPCPWCENIRVLQKLDTQINSSERLNFLLALEEADEGERARKALATQQAQEGQ